MSVLESIVEVQVKIFEDKLLLEWGMTVKPERRWVWPQTRMEVRLYCRPFPDLGQPTLLNTPLADRKTARGNAFKIPFVPLDMQMSREVAQSGFRPGTVFASPEGKCYPLYFDLSDQDIPPDSVICYPAVEWPVTTPEWHKHAFSGWVDFGYTNGDRFEREHREEFSYHHTDTQLKNVTRQHGQLPKEHQELLDAIRDPKGELVLPGALLQPVKAHKPVNLTEYRLGRIAEWSLPRYQLDNRFVNLTLLMDKGENAEQRWQSVEWPRAEEIRFDDLRKVLANLPDRALMLLGAPGSGKSTLLRRLQLDHSIDRLRDDGEQVSFFIQLNGYRADRNGKLPEPEVWLSERWAKLFPELDSLSRYLADGKVLLLLDALNEMPHKDTTEYNECVGQWRTFTQEAARQGNRVVYSCRSLDYSASLSTPDMRVHQIEVQPMDTEQVRTFVQAYIPTHADHIWAELDGSPQFALYQTPYFLDLLCNQVEITAIVPKGRASLFTGFVRQVLGRETAKDHPLLRADTLLRQSDHVKLNSGLWNSPFDLPERGILIPQFSTLAYTMQTEGLSTNSKQVRVDYDTACNVLIAERCEDILKAGVDLNILDEDLRQPEPITFFHQLLQEFFAARRLAQEPNPQLVHVEWHVDKARPTLEETLATLADGDPLPPLPQTGWEETTLTAAPMAKDPDAFIRDLMAHNLPLAARCAASPEVTIDPDLKREIQQALIARSQDFANADLRARISAGLALGDLGDPRFERKTGPHGDYLLPPMIDIPAGTYPMGDDDSQYDFEKPAHTVTLEGFQIGQFPVTNAEYALFMAAGGYEDEQWWDTDEALAWLRGEGSTEGQKQNVRDLYGQLQGISDSQVMSMDNFTSEQKEQFIWLKNLSAEALETWLDETYPSGKTYRQPEFWNDTRFNAPSQPVVGITWFEARAYCKWLSVQTGQSYELPSEAHFEAAARGTDGREYPYGSPFDVARSNTFESHIRRTTPVGIFDNATPEGAFDLTGNAYTWTTSIYDQEQFPYPYQANDGRENMRSDTRRVLRGGAFNFTHVNARAAYRYNFNPDFRNGNDGFRLCCVRAPS